MAIRIVRLGTPRAKGEGARLGTVRRCYCENFSRCHRSVLGELLREHGARLA